jgi:hypothetical protein
LFILHCLGAQNWLSFHPQFLLTAATESEY